MADYYTATADPADNTDAEPLVLRTEHASIQAGFAKVADYTGNANKIVAINSAGTAQEAITTTGTGSGVRATSPTLVTPLLGTPTSGVLTNCTGYPASALAGLGTGVATFLATPSSANLAAAVTDETGSGLLVFATTPTLVTPVLGVATATSINKVAITAPATSATLTIADGKTLTASNTLTFAGTDGSTLNIGAGGTLGTAAVKNTGTSGDAVPLLNTNALHTGHETFQGRLNVATAVAGTVDAITMTFSPAFTALVDKMEFGGRATGANTSTTPTVNPDGLGALTIVKGNGAALSVGDIEGSEHELMFRYNATSGKAVLLNPTIATTTKGAVTATTAGTSVDVTGIPPNTRLLIITFRAVSSSGISKYLLQLGDAGGIETTGYESVALDDLSLTNSTAGFVLHQTAPTAGSSYHGVIVLALHDAAAFQWAAHGGIGSVSNIASNMSGSKSLTAELDRFRLTTVGGTDTFDSGDVSYVAME